MTFLSEKKRSLSFVKAAVFATLCSAAFGNIVSAKTAQAQVVQSSAAQPAGKVDPARLLRPGELKDMTEGQVNAPVAIVEYASLTCGHCADFYLRTMPELREKYIKTGKVYYIFRELALEPRGMAASMLTRCVPEDRFFSFLQLLFEKQEEWAFEPDGKTPLIRFSKMAGLDEQAFNACLTNQKTLDAFKKTAEQSLKDFDIQVTPTIFVNGQKYQGALSFPELSVIIDKAAEEKK